MADREHDQPVDALGADRGKRPRQAGTPVVADDVRTLDPQLVENGDEVGDAA